MTLTTFASRNCKPFRLSLDSPDSCGNYFCSLSWIFHLASLLYHQGLSSTKIPTGLANCVLELLFNWLGYLQAVSILALPCKEHLHFVYHSVIFARDMVFPFHPLSSFFFFFGNVCVYYLTAPTWLAVYLPVPGRLSHIEGHTFDYVLGALFFCDRVANKVNGG